MDVFLRSSLAIILVLFLGSSPAAPEGEVIERDSSVLAVKPDVIFVLAPVVASAELTYRFPQGSKIVRFPTGATRDRVINLTPEFFGAADPEISFEGTKVLFSAQKSVGERWQVWEMNVDGSKKHRITTCPEDCVRAAYLPQDQIVYTAVSGKGQHLLSHLEVGSREGTQAHRITFGPANFELGTVLRDGRILALASTPMLAGVQVRNGRALYTLRPDGTALTFFRSDSVFVGAETDITELDDGSLLFANNSGAQDAPGGALIELQRGAAHESLVGPTGRLCLSGHQVSVEMLILTCSDSPGLGKHANFGLYAFDWKNKKFGEQIFVDPQLSSLQAVPLRRKPRPKILWSTLKPEAEAGYFICLNSYLSKANTNGRLATQIAHVRVLMLDGTEHERVLGEAPVEEDGSFYVAVPSDQPVRFELLDPSRHVIQAQESWIWSRPGEQRGCVGCHEDKAVAPGNHWPLTLRRLDTPTPLGVRQPPSIVP